MHNIVKICLFVGLSRSIALWPLSPTRVSTRSLTGFSTDKRTSRTASTTRSPRTVWTPSSAKIWSVWREFARIAVFVTIGACVCAASTPRPPADAVALWVCPRRRPSRTPTRGFFLLPLAAALFQPIWAVDILVF